MEDIEGSLSQSGGNICDCAVRHHTKRTAHARAKTSAAVLSLAVRALLGSDGADDFVADGFVADGFKASPVIASNRVSVLVETFPADVERCR